LTRFQIGQTYVVGTGLANYLLASGCAKPVADDTLANAPIEEPLASEIRDLVKASGEAVATASERPKRPTRRAGVQPPKVPR